MSRTSFVSQPAQTQPIRIPLKVRSPTEPTTLLRLYLTFSITGRGVGENAANFEALGGDCSGSVE
jgi:hypothetical protein